jgi:hypothetical protein
MSTGGQTTGDGARRQALRIALFALPLLVAVLARVGLPSYFEFESQEDTARTVALLEKGELPLYGIGHVRFLAAALGPLVYYFKAIPYSLWADPAGELLWLMLWHLAGILFSTLLMREVLADLVSASSRSRLVADVFAVAGGCLLALSTHSLGLTSHAHPSNFAATMVPLVAWSVHRWLATRNASILVLAGICLGIMTQLYQLTLFLPALLVAWCVAWPRLPDRRAVLSLLVPIALCYVPYLLSELATGFFNTRNLFVFAPGPQDEGMVGTSSMAGNLLSLASTVVQYRFVPDALDALWLGLAGVGLVRLVAAAGGSKSVRFFLLFLPFYTVLPAVVLGAPRYQLSQPAAQLVIVLGALSVWQGWGIGWVFRQIPACQPATATDDRQSTRACLVARSAGGGFVAISLAVACVLLSGSDAGRKLREPAFYPMRVVAAEPAARTPSLADSRALLQLLHLRFGVTLETLSSRVHSPFAASGHYGHHYILRTVERRVGDAANPPPVPSRRPLLVVDELFPWQVAALTSLRLGPVEVHELPEGADLPFFTLRIDCPDPWCAERSRPFRGPPEVRFFWGCGEFRDLDAELGIPREQCENLLRAPPHTRRYFGTLPPRGGGPDCTGCSDVLWLGVADSCHLELTLDQVPLPVVWQQVKERKFGTVVLPPVGPRGARMVVVVSDCVPWYLDAVRFIGLPRTVPEVIRE